MTSTDDICGFKWDDGFHYNTIHTCCLDRGHDSACFCRCGQSILGVNYPETMPNFIEYEEVTEESKV